jgi:hypothetical protein
LWKQLFDRNGHDPARVLVFSAATSTTVCSSRSCKAAGSAAMTVAAWASFLDAWYSPSAEIYPGAALPFGFGLPRHRAFHRLGLIWRISH